MMKQILKIALIGAMSFVLFSCASPTADKPKQPHSVTYNANGEASGTVPVDETSYLAEATVTVLGNSGNLELANSLFAGWNTKSDGTGTAYEPDDTFAMPDSAVTLFARWTSIIFWTLTFSENDATDGTAPEAIEYSEGSPVALPLNTGNKLFARRILYNAVRIDNPVCAVDSDVSPYARRERG